MAFVHAAWRGVNRLHNKNANRIEEEPVDKPHEKPAALERLKRRADFLRAAKGERFFARAFTLQTVPRPSSETSKQYAAVTQMTDTTAQLESEGPARIGFTVTRQLGGAVKRNRIRRRLKEALRQLAPLPAKPGYDYVLLARVEALNMPFTTLQAEIGRAFGQIGVEKKLATQSRYRRGQDDKAGKRSGKR